MKKGVYVVVKSGRRTVTDSSRFHFHRIKPKHNLPLTRCPCTQNDHGETLEGGKVACSASLSGDGWWILRSDSCVRA